MFHGALMGIYNDVLVSPWPQDLLGGVLQVFLKGLVNLVFHGVLTGMCIDVLVN